MVYQTVGVHVMSLPFYADRLFEYYIPPDLSNKIYTGSFVVVPFGGSNKKMNAVVFEFAESHDVTNLKPIESVYSEVKLSDEELKLCLFIKEHLFCSVSDVVKQLIPPEALSNLKTVYRAIPSGSDERISVSKNALVIYTDILQNGEMTAEKLITRYGDGADLVASKLCEYGYLEKLALSDADKKKVNEERVHLCIDSSKIDTAIKSLKGQKQKQILEYLKTNGSTDIDVLKENFGSVRSTIDSLKEKNYIEIEIIDSYRDPYVNDIQSQTDITLSESQADAYNVIAGLIDEGKPKAALLHGVTGSGKTVVIKSLIDKVISKGRQVIVLVPEISLTPQTVSFFKSFYRDRVAVIHSSLSRGERYDTWRRIKEGKVDVCIGTRSAVFAPFDNIGMIVIDEEHEHTYKSDQTPKYHARDVARFRCAYSNALMLLASATPSVESYYRAQSGIYTLVELKERYNNIKLPETVICDMRLDAGKGKISPIGTMLCDAIENNLEKKEQSILFVNRRGYNNYLSCPLCGAVINCPHCSVSLTYHTSANKEKSGYLLCHYCGFRQSIPKVCPECGSDKFLYSGFGTQKAEDELSLTFPEAKIIRLDADTTATKFSSDKILSSFRKKEADILIGTQMVTKGHNFPDVTLVGVLSADDSLYVSDYRAGERTFSLLTQVIGRAGRGSKPGIAIVQTFSPENPILLEAAAQDYGKFYNNEIAMRKSFLFPPFCDIVLISISSADENLLSNTVSAFSIKITDLAKNKYNNISIQIFGPFEAPIYKLNENYRMRFVVKCRNNKQTRMLFTELLVEFTKKAGKKINFSIDVNPSSL